MPIHYVRDPTRGWLFTTAHGLVTFHDINEHLNVEEYNRDLGRPELIDARSATTNLTADQIRRLAQRAADTVSQVPLGPTAIVTTNDFVFGMARMYSAFAERGRARVEVFREMDAAGLWLQGEGPSSVRAAASKLSSSHLSHVASSAPSIESMLKTSARSLLSSLPRTSGNWNVR